jgi:hypothetical protein
MYRLNQNQKGFGAVELVIILIVAVILAAGGVLLYRHDHKPGASYQQVITKFDTAMNKGNANEVASLESTRFQNWIKNDIKAQNSTPGARQASVSDSYYTLLSREGLLPFISPQVFARAKIKTGGYMNGLYTAPKGTTGKSETFETNAAKYGPPSYLPTLTISVVRKGNTWAVDNIVSYAFSTGN